MTALGDDATVPKILVLSDRTRVGKGLIDHALDRDAFGFACTAKRKEFHFQFED